jgi:hypothetical protein
MNATSDQPDLFTPTGMAARRHRPSVARPGTTKAELAEMLAAGLSQAAIRERTGTNEQALHDALRVLGLVPGTKQSLPYEPTRASMMAQVEAGMNDEEIGEDLGIRRRLAAGLRLLFGVPTAVSIGTRRYAESSRDAEVRPANAALEAVFRHGFEDEPRAYADHGACLRPMRRMDWGSGCGTAAQMTSVA